MTELLIAEDKQRLADELCQDVEAHPNFRIGGVFANGKALLDHLHATPHKPALILLDIEMPVLDGVAAVAEIKTHWPQVLVLMYTVFDDDDKLFQAIRAGADGYLLKGTPVDDLHRYIEEALAGGAPMSPIIARKSLRLLRNGDPGKTASSMVTVEQLTDREIEVLTHLASGLTYQRIADNLFISLGTVRKHVEHIYRKLRVDNRTRAVQRGKDEGWL